jgi:hypothetical protein
MTAPIPVLTKAAAILPMMEQTAMVTMAWVTSVTNNPQSPFAKIYPYFSTLLVTLP